MRSGDGGAYRKPQTGSAAVPTASRIAAREPLKEVWLNLFGDARAVIAHRDHPGTIGAGGSYANVATVGRMTERVVHEVVEQRLQQVGIARHRPALVSTAG